MKFKVSILTVCLNSQETLEKTFNSVLNQTYKNIDHIIVDGGSTDNTIHLIKRYPLKKKKVFIEKGLKLYDSLNFGIKKCTGKFIYILHSDDVLHNTKVISKFVDVIKKNKNLDIVLTPIVFFKNEIQNITRSFKPFIPNLNNLEKGLMPPHTGSFVRTRVYKNIPFNKNFQIAGDFDFFLRFYLKYKISIINRIKIENFISTRMQIGGLSTRNLFSYLLSSKEIYLSLKRGGLKSNYFNILLRFIYKLRQFIFNKKNLNIDLNLKLNEFYKNNLKFDFIILKNFKKIVTQDTFILSAMNLAFLGSYCKNPSLKFPTMYHWPDGISSKILGKDIKKIPGRDLIKKIKIYNIIKRIVVIGNLSIKSKEKLKEIYKLKKIYHVKAPYGSADFIYKNIDYKPIKNDLIFITIPTPKQEELAIMIAKNSRYYKIICIGGSISILSGEEKPVPNIINNLEFIWRLRYETNRRIKRLIETSFNLIMDFFVHKKIKKLKVKIK